MVDCHHSEQWQGSEQMIATGNNLSQEIMHIEGSNSESDIPEKRNQEVTVRREVGSPFPPHGRSFLSLINDVLG